jgi:hypothetical protein
VFVGTTTINVPGFFPVVRAKSDDDRNAVSRASLSLTVSPSSPPRHTSTSVGFEEEVLSPHPVVTSNPRIAATKMRIGDEVTGIRESSIQS